MILKKKKNFLISNKGNSIAEATFEKDCYTTTETVKVMCTLNNSKCNKNIV